MESLEEAEPQQTNGKNVQGNTTISVLQLLRQSLNCYQYYNNWGK